MYKQKFATHLGSMEATRPEQLVDILTQFPRKTQHNFSLKKTNSYQFKNEYHYIK